MRVSLCVHVVPNLTVEDGQDELAITRFMRTYNAHPPGYPHTLILNTYDSPGRDIAAHQHIAEKLNCDLAVFMSARTFFHKPNWLIRMAEAFDDDRDAFYGVMASSEACPLTMEDRPNPHLRTCLFACKPSQLLKAPLVRTVRDGFFFESKWLSYISGEDVRLVTWDNIFCYASEFRNTTNGFRQGDQSDLLAHDRHSAAYDAATPEQKAMLTRIADGEVIT